MTSGARYGFINCITKNNQNSIQNINKKYLLKTNKYFFFKYVIKLNTSTTPKYKNKQTYLRGAKVGFYQIRRLFYCKKLIIMSSAILSLRSTRIFMRNFKEFTADIRWLTKVQPLHIYTAKMAAVSVNIYFQKI